MAHRPNHRITATGLKIVLATFALASATASAADETARPVFWAPEAAPRALHEFECTFRPEQNTLVGSGKVRCQNNSGRPLRRLMIAWRIADRRGADRNLEVTADGRDVSIVKDDGPLLFDLATPLKVGERIELGLRFELKGWPGLATDADSVTVSDLLPRLSWGYPAHADYSVKLDVSPGWSVAASGRLDPETGRYRAEHVRAFGVYLGKGHDVLESEAGDVLVRAVYRPAAEECAKLLVQTATDAINFYRERFGFYPYPVFNIVPGMDYPAGGYPVAPGIVAIHGQQRLGDKNELHWRWITAHEIGHQYWGEYVLERDEPGWLWIGLGIYADREYTRARGLDDKRQRGIMQRYVNAVSEGIDTTVASTLTPERIEQVSFDWNNIVQHGKSFSIVSALACCLGRETFERAYARCLNEFAGRRLGPPEFQHVCEDESGQDLDWFFKQWVWSNRHLAYRIASTNPTRQGEQHVTRVQVERVGDLAMPVPVAARFEDGSEQRRFTDRLLETQTLRFVSDAPLTEVVIDPDDELPMCLDGPPDYADKKLRRAIADLPWTGAGSEALDLFEQARGSDALGEDEWGKLGLCLYGGKHEDEALTAFRRTAEAAEDRSLWSFTALVWQGMLLDLAGRREDALSAYRAALEHDTGLAMHHSQFDLKIDRAWVEQRLQSPFKRQ